MGDMVTKPGFYDGKFRQAGQFHSGPQSDDIVVEKGSGDNDADLDAMSKEQLLAEAKTRGVDVKASDSKADILAALKA